MQSETREIQVLSTKLSNGRAVTVFINELGEFRTESTGWTDPREIHQALCQARALLHRNGPWQQDIRYNGRPQVTL